MGELDHAPETPLLMPTDFKASSKVTVQNTNYNKYVNPRVWERCISIEEREKERKKEIVSVSESETVCICVYDEVYNI